MFRITVKLISVDHSEWFPYLTQIMDKHNLTFTQNKDTYIFTGGENVVREVMSIKDIFDANNKKLILNLGSF